MIQRTFEVEREPDLDVRIESGRVEVQQGEAGRVVVTVDTAIEDFTVEQRGNTILISSDESSSWRSRGSAFVVIEAPAGSDLSVAVASASVQTNLPLGKIDIKTASGDVDLAVADILTVKTASADVRVDRVEQALRLSAASGDLFVSDTARGTVGVSTASGDVRIEESDATLDVRTVSGDVLIRRFSGPSGNFKSMSGDVSLGILSGTSLDLDVDLLSGRLQLPETRREAIETERQISIKAKLVSGDVKIDRV